MSKLKQRNKNHEKTEQSSFEKFQRNLILLYSVISLVTLTAVTLFIYYRTLSVTAEKTSELISADASQMGMNIDSYLENVERNAALLFSDEQYYDYDATDPDISDYQKIQAETGIQNRIADLGLMENYSDFGVVYANDHTVGWISSTTANMFPDGGMYEKFASCIRNKNTLDGWAFKVNGNTDRCYYVKRLNQNAVIVASFFSRELDSAFELPSQLRGMVVRLSDDKREIIYSSDPDEIGSLLPSDIGTPSEAEHVSHKTSDLLIDENVCRNGWRVWTSIPRNLVLSGMREVQISSFVMVILIFLITGLVITYAVRRTTRSMGGVMLDLRQRASVDQLSGLLNKGAFQELVSLRLTEYQPNQCAVFLMMDMDNFKKVNDLLGHKYGDETIAKFGGILSESLGRQYEIGRIGGDEFAAFALYSADIQDIRRRVGKDAEELRADFEKTFQKEREQCGTSVSIGITVQTGGMSPDFETLYQQADTALYQAKRSGKNKVSFYQENGREREQERE